MLNKSHINVHLDTERGCCHASEYNHSLEMVVCISLATLRWNSYPQIIKLNTGASLVNVYTH